MKPTTTMSLCLLSLLTGYLIGVRRAPESKFDVNGADLTPVPDCNWDVGERLFHDPETGEYLCSGDKIRRALRDACEAQKGTTTLSTLFEWLPIKCAVQGQTYYPDLTQGVWVNLPSPTSTPVVSGKMGEYVLATTTEYLGLECGVLPGPWFYPRRFDCWRVPPKPGDCINSKLAGFEVSAIAADEKGLEKSALLYILEGDKTPKHTGACPMWQCTCLPRTVYDFLYPFKPFFRCSQARHFVIFCWLLVAIIRDPGAGTLTGLCPSLPLHLSYWALIRMLRFGTWDAQAVMSGMPHKVLRSLPPAADGKLYLIGDTTHKPKRGRQHPLGQVTRHSDSSPYTFGFNMVVLIASWARFRIPVAIATIDPERQGHQTILFRQMLEDFEPPAWVREVVVVADAGSPANLTLKRIEKRGWTSVFAMPRTRKFANGKYVRDVVHHLPKSCYRRRVTSKPDGRRQDYGVFMRHAELHQLGDVTIVRSNKRRHVGPKRVKIIVTNLLGASAGAILSQYAVRWGVELTIKELQGGLHLGRMQVSQDAERIERSVVLPVCASLLLVHLYGREPAASKDWSLLQLKQRFTEAIMHDQVKRVEQKWLHKWCKIKQAA